MGTQPALAWSLVSFVLCSRDFFVLLSSLCSPVLGAVCSEAPRARRLPTYTGAFAACPPPWGSLGTGLIGSCCGSMLLAAKLIRSVASCGQGFLTAVTKCVNTVTNSTANRCEQRQGKLWKIVLVRVGPFSPVSGQPQDGYCCCGNCAFFLCV